MKNWVCHFSCGSILPFSWEGQISSLLPFSSQLSFKNRFIFSNLDRKISIMCVRFNPCFCCPAEVGVYILSMTQSLTITGAFVLGLVLGVETVQVVSEPDLPIYLKAIHIIIFVWYVISFIVEVVIREYLYKTLELNKEVQVRRCKVWIRMKSLQILIASPFISLHLYVDMTELKIALYGIAFIYHIYYTWVVYHYLRFEITGKPGARTTTTTVGYACSNNTAHIPPIDPGIRISEIPNRV